MSFSPHLLVADDLTGAADCAAYAPALGLRAAIYLHALPPVCADDLQVVSTNSRALNPRAARVALIDSLALLGDVPAARCFKKIDSLLRGNVGAELEAMLERLAAPAALICPALPAQLRIDLLEAAHGGNVAPRRQTVQQRGTCIGRAQRARVCRDDL